MVLAHCFQMGEVNWILRFMWVLYCLLRRLFLPSAVQVGMRLIHSCRILPHTLCSFSVSPQFPSMRDCVPSEPRRFCRWDSSVFPSWDVSCRCSQVDLQLQQPWCIIQYFPLCILIPWCPQWTISSRKAHICRISEGRAEIMTGKFQSHVHRIYFKLLVSWLWQGSRRSSQSLWPQVQCVRVPMFKGISGWAHWERMLIAVNWENVKKQMGHRATYVLPSASSFPGRAGYFAAVVHPPTTYV